MDNEEAASALQSLKHTQHKAANSVRPPVLLVILAGLSLALAFFGVGMAEHENLWALAIYIGSFGVALSMALYHYTFRLLGIKLDLWPRSAAAFKFQIVQAVILAILPFAGRQFRLSGLEFAPHIAALAAGVLFAWTLYRYPSGSYVG